jgi:hypothetical protein
VPTSTPLVTSVPLDELGDRDAPVGSRPWVIWTIGNARDLSQRLDWDVKMLKMSLKQLEDARAWETFGLLSFDMLVAQKVKLDPADARAVLQAKPGRSLGSVLRVQVTAEEAKPLAPHGTNTQPTGLDNIKSSAMAKGGDDAEYLTRRIARDHPDILERMKAGEFTSVRAAALEAGIRKRTIQHGPAPADWARAARKHLTPDEIQELITLLT